MGQWSINLKLAYPPRRRDRQQTGQVQPWGGDVLPYRGPSREKEASVEGLRGIAIVLLVLFHAIGEYSNGGKAAGDTGYFSHINYSFNYLRMPLFTVISGFIYSMRPATSGATLAFLRGKVRRLLVPFLSVTMLTWGFRNLFRSYAHHRLDRLFFALVHGIDHLWFLQAVFLIFIVVAILDRYRMMDRFESWLLWLVVGASLGFVLPCSKVFSFDGFLYLLPYFLLGCGLYRFPAPLRSPWLLVPAALLLLAALTSQQLVWAGRLDLDDDRISPLALCAGVTGNLLLFRFRRPLPILSTLGQYSYSIYLFHFFGLSFATRLARYAGPANLDHLIAYRFLCGLLLPIVVELVFQRSRLTRRLFLGLR